MPERALSSNKEVVKKEGKKNQKEIWNGNSSVGKGEAAVSFTDCLIAALSWDARPQKLSPALRPILLKALPLKVMKSVLFIN